MKDMNIRSRVWVKPIDQMDVWLDSEGYYRKHTARDGTCLFRAVSEQLFLTQAFHAQIRKQVVSFMIRNEKHFQKLVTCPLINYADRMYNPREWGGKLEIEAMSLMYKCDFWLFQELETPAENFTKNGFQKKIMLCFTLDRHYDSVYTKEYITIAAFCQSTVYELLYKRVFGLKEVDYAVNKMLHDKNSRYQREHIPLLSTGFALRLEMRDSYLNVKDLLDFGITPFPYKVAKSLDTEIYRNVEYDTWNEYRKGLRYGFCPWTCQEIQVGAKCRVKLEEATYHGHVQEMQPNKGPVLIFIEELGEMRTIPYECLELVPPSLPAPITPPKPVLPLKLHPLQLVDLKTGKKVMKNLLGKIKQVRDNELNNRNEKPSKTRETRSPQTPVVTSTEYSEQDDDYREEINGYSAQHFQTISEVEEQVCPDSTFTEQTEKVPSTPLMENYRYPIYQAPPPSQPLPPTSLPLPIPEATTVYQQPVTINLMAPKSLNVDGSDLPHTDVATLRFFYNLGLDHLRMNYVVRPGVPYFMNPSVLQPSYITVESPTVPTYEAFPCSVQGSKRQSTYEGTPLIQQCEVSSTVSPAPPPPPLPAVTTYYQSAECDQYCMTMPYVDYSYDYPIYPPSPHGLIPSSYITPEGVIYQTVIPPPNVLPPSSM